MKVKGRMKIISIITSVLFFSSTVMIPGVKVNANQYENVNIKFLNSNVNDEGMQANITFPDVLGNVDDTLIVNNLYSFKGYKGQGKIYITSENVDSARLFINGKEVNIENILLDDGKTYELDFSNLSVNDRNTIQVTNIKPADGKINIKIPYPVVINGELESVGIHRETIELIDTIIKNDIENGFTSAQLAIVKDGVLVKNSSYGVVNSYNQDGTRKENSPEVTTSTLYDLASNTKMYSTNYAIQKLVTEGKINLTDKVSKFFPEFKDGEEDAIKGKNILTIQHLLEHQAGFPADPQYHNDKFNQETQKPDPNVKNILFSQDKETTKQMILKTPLQYEPGTKTVYSDVDYMLLGLIIEKITEMNLDDYVEKNIYEPLGLKNIIYNPLQKGFEKNNIAATELNGNTRDGAINFLNNRTYTIQGEVHDEKAYYSMDGVSGHAGLFSNAEDLAKLAQVMLNDGGYGDVKLFSKSVVEKFTQQKNSNDKWGQGWWRQGENGRVWYFGTQASSNTYGHQGWTGTLTVIDPEENLIIVLLTNKINSPVIDNTINYNMFYGNKFTTATLGIVPTLVYESLIHKNDDAIDANLSQMISEKFKLYDKAEEYQSNAILDAAYSLIDSMIDRAEERPTDKNLSYATDAVSNLNVETQRNKIELFNQRLINIGADEVELPSIYKK